MTKQRGQDGNAIARWLRSFGKKSQPVQLSHREQATIDLWTALRPKHHYDNSSLLAANIRHVYDEDPLLVERIIKSVRGNAFEIDHWKDRLLRSANVNTFRIAIEINAMARHLANNGVPVEQRTPYLYHEIVSILLEDGSIVNPSGELVQALTFIAYLKGRPNGVPWKQGPNNVSDIYNSLAEDANYIAEHLDQVIDLLPELINRTTHDRDTIDMLLNSNNRVLREGLL